MQSKVPEPFKMTITQLLENYLFRPLRLVLTNSSILILVVLVFVLDKLDDLVSQGEKGDLPTASATIMNGEWTFEYIPTFALSAVKSPIFISIAVLTFVIQAVLTVAIMVDMKLIYQKRREGIIDSLLQVRRESLVWYLLWLGINYVVFSVIGLIFYLPSLWFWIEWKVNLIVPLLLVALSIFPLSYSLLSIGAKVAVLPLSWQERFRCMAFVLEPSSLKKVYLFYPLRLGIEFMCLILVPMVALAVSSSRLIAFIAGTAALMVPLAVFRASTFEFFLNLFRSMPRVRSFFDTHYSSHEVGHPEISDMKGTCV